MHEFPCAIDRQPGWGVNQSCPIVGHSADLASGKSIQHAKPFVDCVEIPAGWVNCANGRRTRSAGTVGSPVRNVKVPAGGVVLPAGAMS